MGTIVMNNFSMFLAMTALSLLVNGTYITNSWSLDVLGITESTDKRYREEMAVAAK